MHWPVVERRRWHRKLLVAARQYRHRAYIRHDGVFKHNSTQNVTLTVTDAAGQVAGSSQIIKVR
jgi:hypothetical protein